MDTKSFQVMVTLTVALCIVGIIASVYNIVQYRRMNDSKQVQIAKRMSMATGIIFGVGLVVIVVILTINLNKSSSLNINGATIRPEVGTAKDLVRVFD
uniref:Uncharacterized protein n=1 Tax=Marseillevirus LCMAC202 TaxID=2506606 RepID=A0A481YWU5_9VIRU|nr:MAG: hypothetical protein LCMAC202_00280 [Marseillevirus LCMAC202]